MSVPDDGGTLLGALRDHLAVRVVKDGCSPQGQCGCCTVLVDDAPRVSCVTPVRRVRGRTVTTSAGLSDEERARWVAAFLATGASQCGFCTPGIVCRLVGHERRGHELDEVAVDKALAAHLCRCTGWQTIYEAVAVAAAETPVAIRDLSGATARASLETNGPQLVDPAVVLGSNNFADDDAPTDALVAVHAVEGWTVAETLDAARRAAGKVQGRRTTLDPAPPLEVPEGDWVASLRTSWVEPGYLETDAAWCAPGGEPSDPLANGGAFGGKVSSDVGADAGSLADAHERSVRVLWSREEVVRRGPKRPPIAAGIAADGRAHIRVAATRGVEALIQERLPGSRVELIELAGPPTSIDVRGAAWAEVEMLRAAVVGEVDWITSPQGGRARARVTDSGLLVEVDGGDPLDDIMLRSYAIGAAHMGWSWVTSESIVVDEHGEPHDLTVRSFGIVKAAEMVPVEVEIGGSGEARPIGDAVFAAVAAATWLALGCPTDLPAGSPPLDASPR